MTSETCVHHWNIDPPKGATSRGRCWNCDAQRDFDNALHPTIAQMNRIAAVAALAPSSELEA